MGTRRGWGEGRGRSSLARAGLLLLALGAATAARGSTITVNSAADVVADDGQCTLREAILAANTNTASGVSGGECAAGDPFAMDVIAFSISGSGVHTIKPLTALPTITQTVLIDGYTQPGSSMNTNPFPGALNTVLKIELDNTNSQLRFDGPACIVRGLAINRGTDNIVINADDIVVIGNFIGTDPTGTIARPGGGYGVHILGVRHRADIGYGGGFAPNERNLIAGDMLGGIYGSAGIAGNGSPDGVIFGNFIGTDVTGTIALGRPGAVGVSTANSQVTDNLISGNPGGGMDVLAAGNVVAQGLFVGTQRNQISPLPNGGFGGIVFHGGSSRLRGSGVVAFNDGFGVTVMPGVTLVEVTSYAIHHNTSLGISLTGTATPLANDPCDADTSPGNEGQNFPVLTTANIVGTSVGFIGTFTGKANTTYRIEFFSSSACDASGNGQGETFLGFATAVTDASCSTTFTGSGSFPAGQTVFTATATDASSDPNGLRSTSEFSACFPPPGTQFYTLSPCRILDTRNAAGPYGGPALSDGGTRTFLLAGQCGIPPGARAVAVNMAVTLATAGPGFLTLYPAGAALPLVSSINYKAGQTRANNAVVPLGAAGDISVYCAQGSGTVHFILDVNGYFQ